MLQTKLIGLVKQSTEMSIVKSVLDFVATGASVDDLGNKFQSPDLSATVSAINEFIVNHFVGRSVLCVPEKTNTKVYVAGIISSFFVISIETCRVCSLSTAPHFSLRESDFVYCFHCGSPAHKNCYPNINYSLGVCYCCVSCSNKLQMTSVPLQPTKPKLPASSSSFVSANDTVIDIEVDSDIVDEDQVGDGNTPAPAAGNEGKKVTPTPHPLNSTEGKTQGYDRSISVCKFLLKGKCNHGMSGKSCPAYHPPYCANYQRWGSDKNRGCSKDVKCKYYHPKLCPTKANGQRCTTENCRLHHVRTIRKKQQSKKETPDATQAVTSCTACACTTIPPASKHPALTPNPATTATATHTPTAVLAPTTDRNQDFLTLIQNLQVSTSRILSAAATGTPVQQPPAQLPSQVAPSTQLLPPPQMYQYPPPAYQFYPQFQPQQQGMMGMYGPVWGRRQ